MGILTLTIYVGVQLLMGIPFCIHYWLPYGHSILQTLHMWGLSIGVGRVAHRYGLHGNPWVYCLQTYTWVYTSLWEYHFANHYRLPPWALYTADIELVEVAHGYAFHTCSRVPHRWLYYIYYIYEILPIGIGYVVNHGYITSYPWVLRITNIT